MKRPGARHLHRRAVAAAVTAAVLALGACDSDSDASGGAGGGDSKNGAARAGSGPSVLAPGKPGEPARTLSPEEARKAAPDNTPNSADFDYVHMMITHHHQALQMTTLAPDRAEATPVKRLAERIAAAQKPEVGAMEGWLKINEKAEKRVKGGHGHGHADATMPGMPGMATKAQLDQLRAAKGTAFDELFLKLMITHHQGAITMATQVLSDGTNVLVQEMANDVIAQQTSEINRMRSM